MDSQIKNLEDLESFLNQNKVFDFFNIEKIGVFGSFARGEKARDIDLLMSNANMNNKGLFRYLLDLEKKAGTKLDFVMEEFANPIILRRAQKDLKYVRKH